MFGRIHQSFFGRQLVIDFIYLIDIGLFRLSLLLWVLLDYVFQGVVLFHLLYQICGQRVIYDFFSLFFLVSMGSVVVMRLSILILGVCLCLLSFLLCNPGWRFINVIIFSKNHLLFWCVFSTLFLFSISLIFFPPLVVISFLSSVVGLHCSYFPSSLWWKFRLMILDLIS